MCKNLGVPAHFLRVRSNAPDTAYHSIPGSFLDLISGSLPGDDQVARLVFQLVRSLVLLIAR